MVTEVLMPRQGQSVESCIILTWRKTEGEPVKPGDILCEVETDKATFEVEAAAEGVLIQITQPAGSDVPVLTPIAYIGQPGETPPVKTSAAGTTDSPPAPPPASSLETCATPAPSAPAAATQSIPSSTLAATFSDSASPPAAVSPRARNLAEAKGLNWKTLTGTGPEGRIIARDVLAALQGREPLTPAAVEAAITAHLQAPPAGSGPGGRVLRNDLTAAPIRPVSAQVSGAYEFPGPVEEVSTKGIRKLIADRMLQSLRNHAQLTLNSSADARSLQSFRKKLKESPEALGLSGITLNDFILYAVSRTLPGYPELNAHWAGDKILRFTRIHLAFAVDTPRGLMVPVIKNADLLSLKAISTEAKRLAKACTEGGITPDELAGGTFTISNLGALGIESFTPVLNAPQVAILGVCSVTPKPVITGEKVEFIPAIGLSLTIDHQAVDGAPGARFLKELTEAIADFEILLAKG
jgi:pyruvate dehydrogenase E2 component (dihydrolipoamide acetyltransferase)